MRLPKRRQTGAARPRNRVASCVLVVVLATGLYLAGVGIPELWLLFLVAAWIAFLRG